MYSSKKKQNNPAPSMCASSLRKILMANQAYLDAEAVEFVIKKLDTGNFNPNILKL